LHDIVTSDGEKITLDAFYKEFDDPSLQEIKAVDYALADLGDNLSLNSSYSLDQESNYDSYIRQAAPKEKAFVALQRMISLDIDKKTGKQRLLESMHTSLSLGKRIKRSMI